MKELKRGGDNPLHILRGDGAGLVHRPHSGAGEGQQHTIDQKCREGDGFRFLSLIQHVRFG